MIPFHHLGRRTARSRWWRPVTGTAVLLLGILGVLLATTAVAERLIDRFGELLLLREVTHLVYTQVGIALVLPSHPVGRGPSWPRRRSCPPLVRAGRHRGQPGEPSYNTRS